MKTATNYRAEGGRVYDQAGHDVTGQLAGDLLGFSGGHLVISQDVASYLARTASEVQCG